MLRYILFHHQTTTYRSFRCTVLWLRYILFHHQTTTARFVKRLPNCCVISSFITKPQLPVPVLLHGQRCVISSFITKPQPTGQRRAGQPCCVISSFITKPQPEGRSIVPICVALYPLSSPNHNLLLLALMVGLLRYILFHHQTTT